MKTYHADHSASLRYSNSFPDPFISNRESDLVDIDLGGKTAGEAPVTVGSVRQSFIRLARVDDLQGREPNPSNGDLFHLTDGEIEPVDGQGIRDRCQLEIDVEATGQGVNNAAALIAPRPDCVHGEG